MEITKNKDGSVTIYDIADLYGRRPFVVEGANLEAAMTEYWSHLRYVGHRHCEELLRGVLYEQHTG